MITGGQPSRQVARWTVDGWPSTGHTSTNGKGRAGVSSSCNCRLSAVWRRPCLPRPLPFRQGGVGRVCTGLLSRRGASQRRVRALWCKSRPPLRRTTTKEGYGAGVGRHTSLSGGVAGTVRPSSPPIPSVPPPQPTVSGNSRGVQVAVDGVGQFRVVMRSGRRELQNVERRAPPIGPAPAVRSAPAAVAAAAAADPSVCPGAAAQSNGCPCWAPHRPSRAEAADEWDKRPGGAGWPGSTMSSGGPVAAAMSSALERAPEFYGRLIPPN